MNDQRYPSSIPERPVEGGRDARGAQSRAARRLEARAAIERRHAGTDAITVIPSLPTDATADADDVRRGARSGIIASGLGGVLRRFGRTRPR